MPSDVFHLRPRFSGLAWASSAVGAAAIGLAAAGALGGAAAFGWILGGSGLALGPLYAASPAWRLTVTVDDAGLTVRKGRTVRFALPWANVVRVVWSPTTTTLFVDGGAAERSLLVPGVGAWAPYDLERKPELCRAVLGRVAAERVVEVASLEAFAARPA